MAATGPRFPPETGETGLPGEDDQPRPRRFIRLGIGALLVAVPLAVVALGLAAPVSESNAAGMQVTAGGTTSSTAGSVRSFAATPTALATDDPSATSVIRAAQVRRPVATTTTTTTTTTATSTTANSTTSTSTTAPPATTSPPVPATTAAPQPVPQPASATSAGNSASGQATWYRWKVGNCAHNTLPKGTRVTVTNAASGVSAVCVVGDRGAFGHPTIIDLDASVFSQIAPLGAGRINVSISW